MEESLYRQSRLCRLLGNPVVYSIVAALHERDAMTPYTDCRGRRPQPRESQRLRRCDWPRSCAMRQLAAIPTTG
jgi:hypothetical protein